MAKITKKLCENKNCKMGAMDKRKRFEPVRGEKVCCIECSLAVIRSKTYARKHEKEIRLNNAIEKKKILEKLETHSDWLKKLQKVFNTYIRYRDKDKQCISCKTPLNGRKFDAGHCYSVGAYPNLRFNEDNVHGQCVHCNQHKHGNIHEYMSNLPFVIGANEFELLQAKRNEPLKLTIPEIKELIELYKQKVKNNLLKTSDL